MQLVHNNTNAELSFETESQPFYHLFIVHGYDFTKYTGTFRVVNSNRRPPVLIVKSCQRRLKIQAQQFCKAQISFPTDEICVILKQVECDNSKGTLFHVNDPLE